MLAGATDAVGQAPAQSRQRELMHLLKQDCGSCHGLTLRGGLGPALTSDKLRARPSEGLVATIVHGRAGTAMPPWQRFLTENEARWLVQRMQAGDIDASR
jgi:cytochrome c55X